MKTWEASPLENENFEENQELDEMLYARHVEIENLEDLTKQRGTSTPALYNIFYKYIQNPSTVSVETYKRMVDTDDTIGSGVDFLTTCLAARMGRYTHPNEEIAKFVNKCLEELDGGWTNVQKELLSAAWAGFSVGEKVWANTPDGFVPKQIVTMPPSTILFETNRTGQLTPDGILQYQRNYNPAFGPSGASYLFGFAISSANAARVRPDPYAKFGDFPFALRTANTFSYLSIRIPTQKCIHYSFDAQGKFGNPYGRSLLRRAYKYWVLKDAILNMLATALDRKGTPLTIVYADSNHTLLDPSKADLGRSNAGNRNVGIRADVAAKKAFENIHNDTTIILPGKKGQIFETDFVNQVSNASDFMDAVRMCDAAMTRALLVPSLIFTNGDGTGSYSLGQEHAKTFDKILDGMLSGFSKTLIDQLVKEMLLYNFPEEIFKKDGYGSFSKRELSMDEIDKEMAVIEKAVNVGAIDMNDLEDLNNVRDKINFKPREEIIKKPISSGFDLFGDNPNPGEEK